MTRRSLELRVGITVVIAGLILIIGIMWFQRFKLVEKRERFLVVFPEVGGLTEDDPINVNGVERGRVENIYLRQHDVLVEMGVQEGVKLPIDSRIALRSIGIMGERYVSIRTGTAGVTIQPGDTLRGEIEAGMSEVMGEAGKTLGELTEATAELRSVLQALTEDEKLKASVENLRAFSENLRTITAENQPRLNAAIERFENVASMLDSLFAKRHAALDSSLASIGNAGRNIEIAVENLTEASSALKEIGDELRSGSGTVGRLITDEAFFQKLEKTVTDLDELILDIKMHPGRYLSIHLF